MNSLPIVRYLIACGDILVDRFPPWNVTLVNVVSAIRSLQYPPFPFQHAELCVFAQLANGRGSAELWLQIVRVDDDEVVFKGSKHLVSFRRNPLESVGVRFRVVSCQFPSPGLYHIEPWCDGQMIAQQPLVVR